MNICVTSFSSSRWILLYAILFFSDTIYDASVAYSECGKGALPKNVTNDTTFQHFIISSKILMSIDKA